MRQFKATVEKITDAEGYLTVIGTLYDENGHRLSGCTMRQRIKKGRPVGTANTLMDSARSFLILDAYNKGGSIQGEIGEVVLPDEEATENNSTPADVEPVAEVGLISPWYRRWFGLS